MTFEGQYLTYAEYQELGGSAIGEMPFNLLEFEARRQIDSRTLNRLKNSINIPQEVKICEYALINSINEFAKSTGNVASNGNVASENTDGYSVSYITSDKISDIVNSKQDEINSIIETYLMFVTYNGEHLMYIGV
ncbi:MAG: hypothetical protein IKN65_00800 [Clostridia bacterium]|nr:hypothetical protein [Bacilli bacterium]MBR3672822.1 hypothetical protein [Clostridia bacterium]